MAEEVDYIDISPEKGGARGKKTTVFQETEWDQINDNPMHLTREGVLEKLRIWDSSSNKHVKLKYQTILNRCKTFSPSGKTSDGLIILGRHDDGSPRWVKPDAVGMYNQSTEQKITEKKDGNKKN